MSTKCNHNPAINNTKRQGKYGWVKQVYCSRCKKMVDVQVNPPKTEEEISDEP